VILALVVIGAFAGVGVWGVVAVLQAKRLTESQRMIGVGGNRGRHGAAGRVGDLLLASVLGLGLVHFSFGLNVARARHPVRMTRHQGRDGWAAASASRLSRRRSFFFMPTT